jgi:hypothetical protein
MVYNFANLFSFFFHHWSRMQLMVRTTVSGSRFLFIVHIFISEVIIIMRKTNNKKNTFLECFFSWDWLWFLLWISYLAAQADSSCCWIRFEIDFFFQNQWLVPHEFSFSFYLSLSLSLLFIVLYEVKQHSFWIK